MKYNINIIKTNKVDEYHKAIFEELKKGEIIE